MGHLVGCRAAEDVHVVLAPYLALGQDELAGVGVVRAGYGVVLPQKGEGHLRSASLKGQQGVPVRADPTGVRQTTCTRGLGLGMLPVYRLAWKIYSAKCSATQAATPRVPPDI